MADISTEEDTPLVCEECPLWEKSKELHPYGRCLGTDTMTLSFYACDFSPEEREWFPSARMMPVNVRGIREKMEKGDCPYWLGRMRELWNEGFLAALELALGSHAVEKLQKEED